MARLHHAHRGEGVQAGPHRGTADADLQGEIPLGRQAIAGTEPAAIDQVADESDHLFGAALDAPPRPAVLTVLRAPVAGDRHNWSDQL